MGPCSHVVMPGSDDVTIMGNPNLQVPGIDVHRSLGAFARALNTSVRGEDAPDFKDCRRISIVVEASMKYAGDQEDTGGPGSFGCAIDVSKSDTPEQNIVERESVLQDVVQAAASKGMSERGVSQLWDLVRRPSQRFLANASS